MKIKDVYVGFYEDITVTFKMPLTEREDLKPILDTIETFDKKIDYVLSFRKAKKEKSMNANSYLWVLCDKIAEVIKSTKKEVYRKAIREVGRWDDYAAQEGAPCERFIQTWEDQGIGYFTEVFDTQVQGVSGQKLKHIRAYYGTSNKKIYKQPEISRLINYLAEEAKGLGIETMTPNQIKELEESWRD